LEATYKSNGEVVYGLTTAELISALKLDAGVEVYGASANAQGLLLYARQPVTVQFEKIVDVETGVKTDKPAPVEPVVVEPDPVVVEPA